MSNSILNLKMRIKPEVLAANVEINVVIPVVTNGRTENACMEDVSNGGWITQVRKMEVQSASNMHTNLRRVKMQVRRSQVLICRGGKQVRKRETHLLCVSTCMSYLINIANFPNSYCYDTPNNTANGKNPTVEIIRLTLVLFRCY